MKDKRQGNDLKVAWSIFMQDGEPFRLDGKDVSLYLKNMFGRKELNDFVTTGNIIQWTFYGKDQKNTGKYSLELVINEGEKGMITTDKCDFVNLVSCSCKLQGGEDSPNVETESIELTSTLEYVAGGGDYDDTALWKELENKVDKVEGLGLSEENFTTEEKEKLAGLENYDDSGIKEELTKKIESEVVVDTESTEDFEFGYDDTEIRQEIAELSAEVGKRNVGAEDTDESVEEPSIPSNGMTTPSGDPMHYMYEAVGAEWNGTGADIEKQGVYGDTITHKAGYWYLNELGDITTEEMRAIYAYSFPMQRRMNLETAFAKTPIRTNIAVWDADRASTFGSTAHSQADLRGVCAEAASMEVFAFIKGSQSDNIQKYMQHLTNSFNQAFYFYNNNSKLRKIIGYLNVSASTDYKTFRGASMLEDVRMWKISNDFSFADCSKLSKASLLFAITNSAATKAITITLHADAYARLAEDADIVAALAEKEFVSLASA